MLFSLPNVPKRSLRDPDGELAVVPRLLKGRAALRLVEQAIGHFEASLHKARSEYDVRALEAIMGNYRMGRCIEACLLTHYAFVQPAIEGLLSVEQIAALAEDKVVGGQLSVVSGLRMALWDWVNERYGGFAPSGVREQVLSEFAARYGLPSDAGLVDALLSLDSEASAVLTRVGEAPAAAQLVLQYNRGAVKTLLAHSTRVVFTLKQVPGAALKRTYFVAKRRGVFVDVEREAEGDGYCLSLYGPEQASVGAGGYGLRLAEVSLSLLRSLLAEVGAEAVASATAYLLLHDREYRFHITPEILERLGYAQVTVTEAGRVAESRSTYSVGAVVERDDEEQLTGQPLFDSLLEAKLYREFKSLERQGYTHGWRLRREPDPLLAPGVVMIPDFAFSRGESLVYMEIAGFWTPGYREKKLGKLRALAQCVEETALILAVPQDFAAAYGGLPYPVTPYKNNVRATDLLALLNSRYGDRARREDAAQTHIEALRETALTRGVVPEREVADALQAYSRTELLSSARTLDDDAVTYVPGIGLMSRELLKHVEERLSDSLAEAGGRLSLDDALAVVATTLNTDSVDVESLASALSFAVERPSLFEAFLVSV